MSVNNFFPGHYPWQRILANSSLQIEELTVTENGTYNEDGKAYSPVNVNVSGGGVEHSITCYALDLDTYTRTAVVDGNICSTVIEDYYYISTDTEIQTAYPGDVLYAGMFTQDNVTYRPYTYGTESVEIGDLFNTSGNFIMPDGNCVVLYVDINDIEP